MVFQSQFIPFWGLLPPTDTIDVINYISSTSLGTQGPPGPPGPPGETKMVSLYTTTCISSDYIVNEEDVYIGVDSTEPLEILLPTDPEDGSFFIIKLEMSPPIGNRKVTITGNAKIDGKDFITLKNAYESVTLVYRGNKWNIVYLKRYFSV